MLTTLAFAEIAFLLAGFAFGPSIWRTVLVWNDARGARLATCPETLTPATVSIDAGHAALTAFFDGSPHLRLEACSRWEERGRCDEPCLPQLEASGNDARVESIVMRWYADKHCVFCQRPIPATRIGRHHQPALVGPDGISIEWSDMRPEDLPSLFSTHKAVCWTCHEAERFRRLYPDLIVDRDFSDRHPS